MANTTASVPITVRGRYFWRGDERVRHCMTASNITSTNPTKFFIRGVVYQIPDMQDPISDARLPQLRHDISLFKELGLNTLFVCL